MITTPLSLPVSGPFDGLNDVSPLPQASTGSDPIDLLDAFIAAKGAEQAVIAETKRARLALDQALAAGEFDNLRDAGEERFIGSLGRIEISYPEKWSDSSFSPELQLEIKALKDRQKKEKENGIASPGRTQRINVFFHDGE